jgi:ABC-type transport system substrate-binding protein
MKSRLLVVLILGAILLVLAACAGVGSPASGGQPASFAQASTTPSQAQTVQVILSDSGITADPSTLYVGTPYHFVVTNTGQVTYHFLMGLGRWGGCHMPMGWRQQMTMYLSAPIAPGKTQAFDYTLPASAVGPYFGFGCYQQGEQEGMWYHSTVQSGP